MRGYGKRDRGETSNKEEPLDEFFSIAKGLKQGICAIYNSNLNRA